MAAIWVFDQTETLVAVLSNEAPDACPFWDDNHDERLNSTLTYTFTASGDHPDAEFLVAENLVAIRDLDGNLVLFRIKTVEDSGYDSGRTKIVTAENAALETLYTVVRPQTLNGASAQQAMETALLGTRWTPGQIDWTGVQDIAFTGYITSMAAVQQIVSTFGGELQYRIEMQHGKITGRYVDLLQQRGSATGKTFTYSKDLESISRTVDSTNLFTAMIGVGQSDSSDNPVTFSNVTWNVANGDPVDKPQGQDWVGDPDALIRWGLPGGQHLFGVYSDTEQSDPKKLLEDTWNYLQQNNVPALTYSISVLLLEQITGLDHEKVRLGDTVLVKDMTFHPYIAVYARVIELQRCYTDPTQDQCTLGQFLPTFLGKSELISELQNKLASKAGYWDAKEQTIYRGPTAPSNPSDDELWLDTSSTPNVWYCWNGQVWIKATASNFTDLNGQVTSDQISDGAVGTDQIADSAVGNAQLTRTGTNAISIGTADIQNASIGNAQLDRASANKISITTADIVDAAITNALIAELAVGTANIADEAVTSAKIAKATITAANIHDLNADAITAGTIDANVITIKNLSADSITAHSITADQLQAGLITADSGLIADGAIDTAQIADGSITDAKIVTLAANKLTAGTINTGEVTISGTDGKLLIKDDRLQVFDAQSTPVERVSIGDVNGDGSVYGLQVRGADGTTVLYDENGVYSEGITDGAITNPKIASGAVENDNITAGTITGDRLVANTITAAQIAAQTITANEIASNTITAGQIAAGTITATQIAADTITGDNIASNSITTSNLVVGDFTNYASWPNKGNQNTMPWTSPATADTSEYHSSVASIKLPPGAGSTTESSLKYSIPVIPGDSIYVSYWALVASGFDGTSGNSKLRFGDQNGNLIWALSYNTATTNWTNFTGNFTVPSGVSALTVGLWNDATSANSWIDDIIIQKMVGAAWIQSVNASTITTGTLDASKVSVKNLSASSITTGSMSADRISGGTISDVELVTSGSFDGYTSKVDIKGYAIRFSSSINSNAHADLYYSPEDGSFDIDSYLSAGISAGEEVDLISKGRVGVWIGSSSDFIVVADTTTILDINSSKATFNQSIWTPGSFHGATGGGTSYYTSPNTTSLRSDHSDAGVGITVYQDGSPRIYSMDIYNRTYSGSSNMEITGAGTLGRTTSARKYKLLEEEIPEDDPYKILGLKPKTWYDKGAVGKYVDALGNELDLENIDIPYIERIPGLIAEDVYDAGLGQFVTFGTADEDGNREIEGLQYDRLWVLLIPLVRELYQKVERLEQKVKILG